MKTFFITGGAGFIGGNFILNLMKSSKVKVVNYDKLTYAGNLDTLSSIENNPNYIYAVFGAGFLNNMNFNLSHGSYIIKSSNGGNTWSQVNLPTSDPSEWASLAWHALAISVHPDNPNILFAGGLELYRSNDGGSNWENLSDWSLMYYGGGDRYIHADIHQIIFMQHR